MPSCKNCGETWKRHPVLEVGCPSCGAAVGSWCVRPSGHQAAELHRDREQAALDTGKLRKCPASEPTEQGDQFLIPGVEPVAPRPKAKAQPAQKPLDFGLFGPQGQTDLADFTRGEQ